jgi:hypothetical protein
VARAACLASIALLAPSLPLADPLPVADQNPLLSGLTSSLPLPARLDPERQWMLESAFAWGSSAIMQTGPRESLIVDAETRELRLIAQRGFADRYALRIQLPYRHTSAGSLDGFIDRWHDTFGLPEGVRPSLPEDALRLFYQRNGLVQLDSRSTSQGIGDASVELGRTLLSGQHGAVAGWLGLKLPTGDAEDFTGSGSVGATATIAAERRFADRWQIYGQVAGTWMSEGDRLAGQQRNWMASASAALSARTIGNLVLTVQLDAHTAVFQTDNLDFLDDAVVLSVGGSYRFDSAWELTLGVSEDIAVENSPDVVFLFDLKKTF